MATKGATLVIEGGDHGLFPSGLDEPKRNLGVCTVRDPEEEEYTHHWENPAVLGELLGKLKRFLGKL
ncbi:hypothetical protein LWI29_011543 [Acer saccharum]|uniref:Uncharacterized protein n=1 Tax=Acer saccharum TaxID=4024 RepID=A0AA39S4U6_ACESA|nr:hypothetical protein LWI29_011543 [Acer saccharum]